MGTSTVRTVTKAFLALLEAQTGPTGTLAGVSVTDGPPPQFPDECIYSYGATAWSSVLADMDGGQDETYTVEFAIRAAKQGRSAAAAADRVFDLFNAVSVVADANPNITGTAVLANLSGRDHAVSAGGDAAGYIAVITCGLQIEAFI